MEGTLLAEVRSEVQLPGRTPEDIERYATKLEEILEQKEDIIIVISSGAVWCSDE